MTFQATQPKSAYRHLFMRYRIPNRSNRNATAAGARARMTTNVDECLSGLMLAQGFLGEGGFEAALGDDWREQLENAEVTFADDNHASVPPLTPDEEGPTELVREDGEWRIVVEEE